MRGEFIRGDGLIIPNNISRAGAAIILAAALRNDVPTLFAALVKGTPTPTMTSGNVVEPSVGVGGYSRISIPRTSVGWPVQGVLGDEAYIESQTLTWTGTGSGFDQPVRRIALLGTSAYNAADAIYALSAALPSDLTVQSQTPIEQRQFKYRIYI
jgi:hypothetical protein